MIRKVLSNECNDTQTTIPDGDAGGRRARPRAVYPGHFQLSTGDQCGPETPDQNLFALVETAKTYGVYDRQTGKLGVM